MFTACELADPAVNMFRADSTATPFNLILKFYNDDDFFATHCRFQNDIYAGASLEKLFPSFQDRDIGHTVIFDNFIGSRYVFAFSFPTW